MKVAIFDCGENVINTALMQISFYHKSKGDVVEWYHPLMHETYNKIYCSSLFDFTDKSYVRKDMVCGGTGFDLKTKLPEEIERSNYDYSIYPDCNFSILWFSRGCIRNCSFCVVRQKEGFIKTVKPKNLNPKGKVIRIQDNNFFASKDWPEAVKYLKSTKQKIIFDSGIDIRIFNDKQGEALKNLKVGRYLHFAWDNPKDNIEKNVELLKKYVPASNLMCYVLIGFDSDPQQDLMRVEKLRDLNIAPFVMPFNKQDHYQNKFARWVNHKAIFKSVKWKDYN